jgi:hypothetical protein
LTAHQLGRPDVSGEFHGELEVRLLRSAPLRGYSFFKTKDKEVGVALGLHVAGYDANLSGNFNGAPINSQSEKLTAPLPVLSAYGQFALTDRWAVGGRMDRFALKYGKFSGNLTGIALDVMYQPFKNVGFGIGSRALALKVAAETKAARRSSSRRSRALCCSSTRASSGNPGGSSSG